MDDLPTRGIADDWLFWLVVSVVLVPRVPLLAEAVTGRVPLGTALDAFSPLLWVAATLGPSFVVWGWLRARRRSTLQSRHRESVVADGIWDAVSYARARGVPRAFSIRSFAVVVTADRVEVWQGLFAPRLVVTWLGEDITSLSAGSSSERLPAPTLRVTTSAGTTSLLLLEKRWVPVARMRGRSAARLASDARRLLAPIRPHTTAHL